MGWCHVPNQVVASCLERIGRVERVPDWVLLTLKTALVEAGGVVLVLALGLERGRVVATYRFHAIAALVDGKRREVEALVARVATRCARHHRSARRRAPGAYCLIILVQGLIGPLRTGIAAGLAKDTVFLDVLDRAIRTSASAAPGASEVLLEARAVSRPNVTVVARTPAPPAASDAAGILDPRGKYAFVPALGAQLARRAKVSSGALVALGLNER